MEKQAEQVFVKVNQRWQRATVVGEKDGKVSVMTNDGQSFKLPKNEKYFEPIKSKEQKFAYGDVREQLEGQYISYEKLSQSVRNNLTEGKEHFHESTYISEGELKESAKMVQMVYDRNLGSRLDVQYRRNEMVTLDKAWAYNHSFSADEYDRMAHKKEFVLFQGSTNDGEVFQKLAYYEPKVRDIRTKAALSPNTYFYGAKLTVKQADALNRGQELEMEIKSKVHGTKPYLVSYSPRRETFITKNIDLEKAKKLEVNPDEKKKSRSRGIKV
ncbi:hypothetical protein HZY62_08655 [Maribacter polysiphoniae]|uniref:Uncharacterized protein n=2 Tax=Flavobacteriaceae TaxID=49546 RepID=A0A316E297_9FLAO|nr:MULTISPECIES: hypothetical protein [Flavobacteriaceae]MBD1260655.1 hypothetical protein [Maribacter polysiphoniae]PWK24215.1 hypothetical protein LX92_01802 [Maribacter polysiphoniae]RPG33276.1 MAG: hypothetical protein CBB72_009870 [Muricauda sp. TMED12]RYC51688.1 hypothetical protein DN53_12715 [Allomuricauda olearia]|tara:strand:+ start:52552 stop:53364 length:813 start_codon:yes stop_codon:yes gene_type:complete